MGETLILLFGFGLLAGYKYMFRNERTGSESLVYLSLAVGLEAECLKFSKEQVLILRNVESSFLCIND